MAAPRGPQWDLSAGYVLKLGLVGHSPFPIDHLGDKSTLYLLLPSSICELWLEVPIRGKKCFLQGQPSLHMKPAAAEGGEAGNDQLPSFTVEGPGSRIRLSSLQLVSTPLTGLSTVARLPQNAY